MEITILGSGTSTGVPEVGCQCPVCTSTDERDKRLRTSALVETDDARILIDCGPDFRQQMMKQPFKPIDAVIITHEHYDHVGGLDDLRPFCRFKPVPIYAEKLTADRLRTRMPYCFIDHSYPGIPNIPLNDLQVGVPFYVNKTQIRPFRVMHGKMPILGYRIGGLGYVTDMLTMPEESYLELKSLDVLIVNALHIKQHPSHQNLEEALQTALRIGAKETYFIHMSHKMGLHAQIEQNLPPHIHFAYDGLKIN